MNYALTALSLGYRKTCRHFEIFVFLILKQTTSFIFLLFTTLQYSTRVSNELGAGHPQVARLAVHVVLLMAFSEGIVVGIVMLLVRNIWGYAYSNEVDVVRYVADMMPILAISNLIDGLQAVLSG